MARIGRSRTIESVEQFSELCNEYIQWVKDNPVEKTVTASFQGVISYERVPHMRPMTQMGLAAHMGIGLSTLKDYGQREEFSAIFREVTNFMTAWNIDGATSGDFNGNIVARIEGLAEKSDVNMDAKIETKTMEDIFK